jgi:replicative DNA helicase
MSESPDEVDRHKAGTLPEDPKADTKPTALQVPRIRTMREILTASRIKAFSKDPIEYLTTTHYRLDDITGGIRGPDNWVIAADTSFGKTSWLIAIADDNIRHRNKKVMIVSTEDSDERFGARFMVRRSGVDAKRYRNRKLLPDEMRKVVDAEAAGEPIPVYLDARGWDIDELCPHVLKVIDEQVIDLVAFDYLQEFQSKRRYQDERVKFKEIAAKLRRVGTRSKRRIPTIILSQLTLSEKTGVPTRANIRECRDVANAADTIMIGFEPENNVLGADGKEVLVKAGTKCIYVDKVKDGERKAKVPMNWNSKTASFDTVLDPEAQRFQDVVGDQFDDYGEAMDAQYP